MSDTPPNGSNTKRDKPDSLQSVYQGTDTYILQDHHQFVKENFEVMGDLLQNKVDNGEVSKNASVLDVGCATGALIKYLKQRFADMHFVGVDVSGELISIAKKKVPNASFLVGGVHDLQSIVDEKFDVVLCFGVIGIFDERKAEEAVDQMIHSTKNNGFVYLFSQFNEYAVDVQIRYRRVDEGAEWLDWGVGWNNYSFQTVSNWVSASAQNIRFIDFEMKIPLEPKENPIRSWTYKSHGGAYKLTNGLKLMIDLRFCEIQA